MARTSPKVNALMSRLAGAEESAMAAKAKAKAAGARAAEAAKSASEVWPELIGSVVAGAADGAGISYDYDAMGILVPTVPLAAGTALMLGTKGGSIASRMGRGMLVYGVGLMAQQLAGGQ